MVKEQHQGQPKDRYQRSPALLRLSPRLRHPLSLLATEIVKECPFAYLSPLATIINAGRSEPLSTDDFACSFQVRALPRSGAYLVGLDMRLLIPYGSHISTGAQIAF